MKRGFTYIVASPIRAIYTGVTSNLERRVWEHKHGVYEGFSKNKGCINLDLCEEHSDIRDALAREREIKGWIRARKIALIERDNPGWRDLASDWYTETDVMERK
ncbi:MAG: GIY-YIG nuclease family protein [Thermomicrobiales bacterium]